MPDDSGVLPEHGGCRCATGSCQRGACPCACAVLVRDEQVGCLRPAWQSAHWSVLSDSLCKQREMF